MERVFGHILFTFTLIPNLGMFKEPRFRSVVTFTSAHINSRNVNFMFRHRSRQQRILAILMLLGLLFQVQTVLACQMTGANMPVEHCCCDDAKPTENVSDQRAEQICCEIDTELSLKDPNLQEELPAVLRAPPTLELPDAVAVMLLVAFWPSEGVGSTSKINWVDTPQQGLLGTKTYLTTRRLRI